MRVTDLYNHLMVFVTLFLRAHPEKKGMATEKRPEGILIWLHGASIGECTALLPVIEGIKKGLPHVHFLLTSTGEASRTVMPRSLPPGVVHQFLPWDCSPYVDRFLSYWRPDFVIWMEGDFWPSLLLQIKVPLILLNGRLSQKTFQRWKLILPWAQKVFQKISSIRALSDQDADRFYALGAKNVTVCDNIKYYATPRSNPERVKDLRALIGTRPFWIVASLHTDEEPFIQQAHQEIVRVIPEVLTIVVPRHIHRPFFLKAPHRSRKDSLTLKDSLYVADTWGELGSFYALGGVVFLGGSLMKIGGHTPIEPALYGCPLVTGPYVFKNKAVFDDFFEANACACVHSAEELSQKIITLLKGTDMGNRAQDLVLKKRQGEGAFLHTLIDQISASTGGENFRS